jgi:hypothetical protein
MQLLMRTTEKIEPNQEIKDAIAKQLKKVKTKGKLVEGRITRRTDNPKETE